MPEKLIKPPFPINPTFPNYPMHSGYENIESSQFLTNFFGPSQPAPVLSEYQMNQIRNNSSELEGSAIIISLHETYADKRAQLAALTQQVPTIGLFLSLIATTLHNPVFQNESIEITKSSALLLPLYWLSICTPYAVASILFGRLTEIIAKPLVDAAFHAHIKNDLDKFIHSEGLDHN